MVSVIGFVVVNKPPTDKLLPDTIPVNVVTPSVAVWFCVFVFNSVIPVLN